MATLLDHQTIKTNGVKLHLVEAGPKKGPLVILLHGFPEFWYGWRRQIEALASSGFHVLVPDQRGYNTSEKPKAVTSYHRDILAQDVIGLIESMGKKKATVIGHDWGGVVAWWAAGKHPEYFKNLIVLNAPHPKVMSRTLAKNWRQKLKSSYMMFFQIPHIPEWVASAGNFFLTAKAMTQSSRKGTFTEQDIYRYKEAWSQPGSFSAMLAWYRAAFQVKLKPPADPEINIPTLLIWGKKG